MPFLQATLPRTPEFSRPFVQLFAPPTVQQLLNQAEAAVQNQDESPTDVENSLIRTFLPQPQQSQIPAASTTSGPNVNSNPSLVVVLQTPSTLVPPASTTINEEQSLELVKILFHGTVSHKWKYKHDTADNYRQVATIAWSRLGAAFSSVISMDNTNIRNRGLFSERHFGNLRLAPRNTIWSYNGWIAQQQDAPLGNMKVLKRGDKPAVNGFLDKIVRAKPLLACAEANTNNRRKSRYSKPLHEVFLKALNSVSLRIHNVQTRCSKRTLSPLRITRISAVDVC